MSGTLRLLSGTLRLLCQTLQLPSETLQLRSETLPLMSKTLCALFFSDRDPAPRTRQARFPKRDATAAGGGSKKIPAKHKLGLESPPGPLDSRNGRAAVVRKTSSLVAGHGVPVSPQENVR